ncbi:MAG TPA: hypothetical protein VD815_05275 [Candidatus Saccharimonadales bacterium]|nr:hypothetical protein [Candidatus Saccharimonadales bacterium]
MANITQIPFLINKILKITIISHISLDIKATHYENGQDHNFKSLLYRFITQSYFSSSSRANVKYRSKMRGNGTYEPRRHSLSLLPFFSMHDSLVSIICSSVYRQRKI